MLNYRRVPHIGADIGDGAVGLSHSSTDLLVPHSGGTLPESNMASLRRAKAFGPGKNHCFAVIFFEGMGEFEFSSSGAHGFSGSLLVDLCWVWCLAG